MSTEITTTSTSAVQVMALKASLNRMIAEIAAVYPPKLSDDMPLTAWMRLMSETVGAHPAEVLTEARSVLLSTSQFAPTPKEFVDAILAAYVRLKLPLSDDAKRHLAYRKKTSTRYITGENGKQRFVDDAKLTAISFVSVAGLHANMVMDTLPYADVADVEKALISTSSQFGKREGVTLKDIIKSLEFNTVCECAYRKYGKPADLCGGDVAEDKSGYKSKFKAPFLALSTAFVYRMGVDYPKAMITHGSLSTAFAAVAYAVRSTIVPDGYGHTFQAEAEAQIADAMKAADVAAAQEMAIAINTDWRFANARKDDAAKVDAEERAFALKKYVTAKGYDVKIYEKPSTFDMSSLHVTTGANA